MFQNEALELLKLGENVFLTGAAGSGKTWLLNTYIRHLREHNVEVAVTASTGIAATHLNGKTIHSWSGIGVRNALTAGDLDALARSPRVRRNYEKTSVLVIDEISMLHPWQLDMVDRVARHVLDASKPFGGLQVILCGDFFQLPPVGRDAMRAETFAYDADAWKTADFRICYLHEQHRQGDDALLTILNDIRNGSAGEQTRVPLRTRYKREPEGGVRPTRLYARNVNVDRINDAELAKIDGKERIYRMESRGFGKLVDGLKKNCLAPEMLRLKIGADVMFIRNAQDGAYVNGTRGVVESFADDGGWPVVRTASGGRITASAEEWQYEENGRVQAAISQVPLRLAWAITIHKSQGMTLDAAEIDLGDAFEPGMGYVALSRVRSLAGLKLMNLNDTALTVHPDILAYDGQLKEQSRRAREYLAALPQTERKARQDDVLLNRFKGSREKVPLKAPQRSRREKAPKTPTHLVTRELLLEKISLQEIAKRREFTLGTILNHLEKLKGAGELPAIDHLKDALPANDFSLVLEAFRAAGDGRLTPVHQKFEGRYSFEDLRLVRLFAW